MSLGWSVTVGSMGKPTWDGWRGKYSLHPTKDRREEKDHLMTSRNDAPQGVGECMDCGNVYWTLDACDTASLEGCSECGCREVDYRDEDEWASSMLERRFKRIVDFTEASRAD